MTETNMRGILFKNEKKEGDGPNRPDFSGNARIGEQNFYVSGWVNIKGENKYLTLSFTPEKVEAAENTVKTVETADIF